jgi:hypothetical protein
LVKPRRDKQMVSLVPIIAWLAALLAMGIAIGRDQHPRTMALMADRLLRAVLIFPLGLMSLWAAFGHIFFPEMAARAIGWQTSPLQFEVGVANLGIGMAALYAAFRGRDAQIAAGLVAAGFLGGAGIGHIRTSCVRAISRLVMRAPSCLRIFSPRSRSSFCFTSLEAADPARCRIKAIPAAGNAAGIWRGLIQTHV